MKLKLLKAKTKFSNMSEWFTIWLQNESTEQSSIAVEWKLLNHCPYGLTILIILIVLFRQEVKKAFKMTVKTFPESSSKFQDFR